jgi:hypothetical protein
MTPAPLLFEEEADVEEFASVGHTLIQPTPLTASTRPAPNLANTEKVLATFGLGGTGKTTWLRWAIEQMLARNEEQNVATKARAAAIDPENRDLLKFFPAGIFEPASRSPDKVAAWTRSFLDVLIRDRASGLIDTGGGDTAFGRVLVEMPNLVDDLKAEDLTMVAVYLFSPRVSSLSSLSTLSEAGFRPEATALILNEGTADPEKDLQQEFAQVRRHPVYKAALDRGSIEIWMPSLAVARKIDERSFQFRHAAHGIVPEGRKAPPLGWSDQRIVRSWLRRMDTAMAPIQTWIP